MLLSVQQQADSSSFHLHPVQHLNCHPPAWHRFTETEILQRKNQVNRQSYLDVLVDYPLDSIVEYPYTGETTNVSIGHMFSIDPNNFYHPKLNVQYSLGDCHGMQQHVKCKLLRDQTTGAEVLCKNEKIACKGLKICKKFTLEHPASRFVLQKPSAKEEVFNKTLAFFCALYDKGCSFDPLVDGADFSLVADLTDWHGEGFQESASKDELESWQDCRSHRQAGSSCKGKIQIHVDQYNRPIVRCQHRKSTDTAHLIIRNLDEFEIPYLRALLQDDPTVISKYETDAAQFGYGPLVGCSYAASPTTQKQLCPYWHRFSNGKLRHGRLERHRGKCSTTFNIYTPEDLVSCPQILIICNGGPHSHPDPSPVKTPPPILNVFHSLLKSLDWKLADATPRKIMVDSGFITGLRQHLNWKKPFDPSLADLHPSLTNMDHARRYINELQTDFFPSGTGFEGAQLLVEQHLLLPRDEQYIRCAETHTLDDGKTFYLIICMSYAMSAYLMQADFISIDTSFKRLHHKWQEFEIETWDVNHMRSVVATRAFTTSQSAQAHLILFTRIFDFACADTGLPVRFRHIHGSGISVCTADAHKGQALGLGLYCQQLCRDVDELVFCQFEPSLRLRDMLPYQHLRRFFCICLVHFKQNIHELRAHITDEVRYAMLSLASTEVHPDIKKAFELIKSGGPKARAWLKDKLTGCPFALPALYHPESLIPLDAWKASPPSSNGNEQSHRGINRDGVNLTILGGIMRGWQYDRRAFRSLELHSQEGVYTRDTASTHFYRFGRSVDRAVAVQRRTARREPAVQSTLANHDNDSPTLSSQNAASSDFSNNFYNNGIEGGRDDEHTLWAEPSSSEVVLDDSPYRTNETEQDAEAEISVEFVDLEPSSTEVVCGNISCGGFDGAQDGKTAEGSVFEPSRLVVRYQLSSYSELAGALDVNSNTPQLYEPASGPYPQPQSVSALEEFIQCTFAGDTSTTSIPYDPSIHQSSFSTLNNALSKTNITYYHYS